MIGFEGARFCVEMIGWCGCILATIIFIVVMVDLVMHMSEFREEEANAAGRSALSKHKTSCQKSLAKHCGGRP